jgi:alcohol dehydrogenase, propanol-preferring
MKAMVLHETKTPLRPENVDRPEPSSSQVLVEVEACGVCRTDLHVVDDELPKPKLPLILGHQIVGKVVSRGSEAGDFEVGERVGIPWMGWTCGECKYCRSGRENLCDHARFTGYTLDGGYAEFAAADHRFCIPIPDQYEPVDAAPLLCAGLIGFRTYRKAGDAKRLGFYGFGAAAHLISQIALYEDREIYAFTRPGDKKAQDFARSMGAVWAGDSDKPSPEELDAALIFAPVGPLVPAALRAVCKGGVVVCGGIHMSDIPAFPYSILWEEREIVSVANLTREDGRDFMKIAPRVPVKAHTETFALEDANEALNRLRSGKISGAAVLVP